MLSEMGLMTPFPQSWAWLGSATPEKVHLWGRLAWYGAFKLIMETLTGVAWFDSTWQKVMVEKAKKSEVSFSCKFRVKS